jgi:protein transport protein SEC20
MANELEKGQRTLAAMEESRETMKRTKDEYDGDQRSELSNGGVFLTKLERQAVWERRALWSGFACFVCAALHVVLKRTPILVRFHPLWWIRHAQVRKARDAAKAAKAAAGEAAASRKPPARVVGQAAAAAPLVAAAAAAAVALGAAMDDFVADSVYAEAYLDETAARGEEESASRQFEAVLVETGEYSKRDEL